ncbi:MAG TPA: hypothetical protein VMV10_26105 [Pirellulales bacterium]|nr:hypothetical protein [Pirellulales bacterium]HVB82230.1 hypothetical protein [Candidatus Binataceae bacterium]
MADAAPQQPADGAHVLNSELEAPLQRIAESVGGLHTFLDGFGAGRTRELRGQGARDAVYESLAAIDADLKAIERIRASQTPPFQRVVTPALVRDIGKAIEDLHSLRTMLYEIVSRGGDAYRSISASENQSIFIYLDLIGDGLKSIQKRTAA